MPKKPIYQELASGAAAAGQTLQEWLFGEIRLAILDGRLRATKVLVDEFFVHFHWQRRRTVRDLIDDHRH